MLASNSYVNIDVNPFIYHKNQKHVNKCNEIQNSNNLFRQLKGSVPNNIKSKQTISWHAITSLLSVL